MLCQDSKYTYRAIVHGHKRLHIKDFLGSADEVKIVHAYLDRQFAYYV